jgi:hypothetical protein
VRPGRARQLLERAADLRRKDREVRRLAVEREGARLGKAQRAQVLDKPRQHPRFLEDRAEVLGIGGIDPVHDRLGVALDDGQRRAQLVAHVGEEAAALGLVGLEA